MAGSHFHGPFSIIKPDQSSVEVFNENGELQIPAGALSTADIADEAITLAKMDVDAKTFTVQVNLATIATTGNTDASLLIGRAGTLTAAYFNGTDALAANDTNFIAFSLTNFKADGTGTDAMLSTGDTNTTKATGGSALSAVVTRTLQISGTPLNLAVSAGHRLRFRAAANGTLANTVTNGIVTLVFTAA